MDYMEKITELRAQKKGLKDQADTLVTEGKFEEASALADVTVSDYRDMIRVER